uniref:Uncharacterized protein n=1 Tax=Clastoptera arizonana TaxID=38151 RepID=A0A1B6CG12_9HEMI
MKFFFDKLEKFKGNFLLFLKNKEIKYKNKEGIESTMALKDKNDYSKNINKILLSGVKNVDSIHHLSTKMIKNVTESIGETFRVVVKSMTKMISKSADECVVYAGILANHSSSVASVIQTDISNMLGKFVTFLIKRSTGLTNFITGAVEKLSKFSGKTKMGMNHFLIAAKIKSSMRVKNILNRLNGYNFKIISNQKAMLTASVARVKQVGDHAIEKFKIFMNSTMKDGGNVHHYKVELVNAIYKYSKKNRKEISKINNRYEHKIAYDIREGFQELEKYINN